MLKEKGRDTVAVPLENETSGFPKGISPVIKLMAEYKHVIIKTAITIQKIFVAQPNALMACLIYFFFLYHHLKYV
ncbi:hypothetical protein E3J74_04550 [Candidatus Bathyarchaeota archaeon]|nr:MAG: hypothetical protein E3J74_04550 [Candidatus Bathyarchaeota archaeon]